MLLLRHVGRCCTVVLGSRVSLLMDSLSGLAGLHRMLAECQEPPELWGWGVGGGGAMWGRVEAWLSGSSTSPVHWLVP